ncbi:DUF4374 domain-containing protein [Dyadobacter koreensis]|nr:DUF4374 domain-containing protein [Dyadobacter koreensis]
MVMSKDNVQYIIQTDTLDGGVAYPIKNGAPVLAPPRIWYYMMVKDGNYFFINRKTEYLIRNQVKDNKFTAIDSVSVPGMKFLENYNWYHPDSLLIISWPGERKSPRYARINTRTMKASTGVLPLPAPFLPFNNMTVGFSEFRNNQLWLGYSYHYSSPTQGYGSSDTVYVASLDYPALSLKQIFKDPRSAYPGNVNTAQQNTFRDDQDDFYYMACPGIARGANPGQPTAIYRIKANENKPDSSYFFNISASPIDNHAYGMWYIGNNKAIVRSERQGLFKTFEEHYLVPHIDFFEVDLQTKTLHKLDLPLDKGTSRSCVLVENGLVYISINSDTEGNYIWVYNPKSQSLKKGLKLEGKVDYIFRLEKLHG